MSQSCHIQQGNRRGTSGNSGMFRRSPHHLTVWVSRVASLSSWVVAAEHATAHENRHSTDASCSRQSLVQGVRHPHARGFYTDNSFSNLHCASHKDNTNNKLLQNDNNNSNEMLGSQHPNALNQVLMVSFVCFACPGLFNALNSIAAGIADVTIAFNAGVVLNATFAVAGLVCGGLVNVFGPKWSLFVGTWGYVIYTASLLVMKEDEQPDQTYTSGATGFFYAANVLIGIGAGFLWTAQGQITMAYPTEEMKGKYFAYFWIIFNLGGTFGGLLTFATNYESTSLDTSTATYVVFLVLMAGGALLSLTLAKPENVKRNDGTLVKVQALPDWQKEMIGVVQVVLDPKMLLLFPLFSYSNWFYNYHTCFNRAVFNARTGGLASAFYWAAQMLGAYLMGLYLDRKGTKKYKALSSIGVLTVLIFVMWGLGLWVQLALDLDPNHSMGVDFKDHDFIGKFLLYFFYGFNDAICQVWSYWLMGQMTDDMALLGRYAGYYKCVQSGMAALANRLGGIPIAMVTNVIVNWVLATVGLICAFISVSCCMEYGPIATYDDLETPLEHKPSSMEASHAMEK